MFHQDVSNKMMVLAFACGLAMAGRVWGDSIHLRPAVRLVGEAKIITLADIADLDGPEATRLATLTVAHVTDPTAVVEIPINDVRNMLDQAGVNWALVNLSGRKVIVRPSRDGSTAAPLAMTGTSLNPSRPCNPTAHDESKAPSQSATAQDLMAQGTLRSQIADRIVAGLHVDPRNLRLGFDDSDAAFLDSAPANTRIEFDPQSNFSSDRLAMTVRLWSDNRVQSQRTLSVQPLLLVKAATAAKDIEKDQVISDDDVTGTDQWLAPSQAAMTISLVQAVGRAAAKHVNVGEVLRDKSIRREALVRRGDQVMVRCLVGGVAISMQAEARADGSEGETIEFRKQGERESFRATVTRRGEAVVDRRSKQPASP